jgi:hypothetical protein
LATLGTNANYSVAICDALVLTVVKKNSATVTLIPENRPIKGEDANPVLERWVQLVVGGDINCHLPRTEVITKAAVYPTIVTL